MLTALIATTLLIAQVPNETYNKVLEQVIDDDKSFVSESQTFSKEFFPLMKGRFHCLGHFVGHDTVQPLITKLDDHEDDEIHASSILDDLSSLAHYLFLDGDDWKKAFNGALDEIEELINQDLKFLGFTSRLFIHGMVNVIETLHDTFVDCVDAVTGSAFNHIDFESLSNAAEDFLYNPTQNNQSKLVNAAQTLKSQL